MKVLKAVILSFVFLFGSYIVKADVSQQLAVGNKVADIEFKDINKQHGNTAQYKNRIRVYTFAGRESSDRLMAWMNNANLDLYKKYPNIEIAYINFADVSSVPRLFRRIVEPILRKINKNADAKMKKMYSEAGINVDPQKTKFHLIPDWDGLYLEKFGISSADNYYCWIENKGVVVAALHEPTAQIASKYLAIFDKLQAPLPATKAHTDTTGTQPITVPTEK